MTTPNKSTDCVVAVIYLVIAGVVGCAVLLVYLERHRFFQAIDQPRQCPQPWMVYDTGTATLRDIEAIERWLVKRAKSTGASYYTTRDGKDGVRITLHLSTNGPPRSELLEIAAEALANLPAGSPVTIDVETLDEAIADEAESIRDRERNIVELGRLHGE